jgi:hypothetical protein
MRDRSDRPRRPSQLSPDDLGVTPGHLTAGHLTPGHLTASHLTAGSGHCAVSVSCTLVHSAEFQLGR